MDSDRLGYFHRIDYFSASLFCLLSCHHSSSFLVPSQEELPISSVSQGGSLPWIRNLYTSRPIVQESGSVYLCVESNSGCTFRGTWSGVPSMLSPINHFGMVESEGVKNIHPVEQAYKVQPLLKRSAPARAITSSFARELKDSIQVMRRIS